MTRGSCRKRLACVNSENVVYLYDAKGELQDKFKAKCNPDAEGADHPFTVTCMAYSPDSTRLALGQSDGILYVYKLGLEWKGKKSISNKFPVQACSSILQNYNQSIVHTCSHLGSDRLDRGVICALEYAHLHEDGLMNAVHASTQMQAGVVSVGWRPGNDNELVFALSDGSFHRGSTAKNRSAEVFRHPSGSAVVAMAQVPPSTDNVNPGVFLAHADSSLFRYTFEATSSAPNGSAAVCKHTCVPTTITANSSTLLVCGSDLVMTTYNHSGRVTSVDDLVVSMPQV